MPLSVRHIFSNAIADGTNTQIVRPSDWNSAHALTLNLSGTDISAAFANANGISFGTNAGGSVTASHNALTSQSNQALSGSNGSFTFQTATFGNSNGVSFLTTNGSLVGSVATSYAASNHSHGNPTLSLAGGLSGATASNSAGFTLSLTQASAAPSPINFSAGTTTSAVSGLTFSDANRVSFGLGTGASAGVVTGSIDAAGTTTGFTGGASISGSMTHNTAGLAVSLSHPAWLTTAMQSNAATISNIRVSGGTTSNLLSAMTFADGNGVSFGLNAGTLTASHNGLTTAMASNRGSDFMGTNTALTANGVSVTANSSGLSLNFPAFLTTAMASNRGSDFVHASAAFAGTNASGTIASNGVSVSVAAQSVQPVAVSASNGSYNFSTLKFVEGSGVTWATQANGIQASVKTDYLTTAMLSNAATISNINFSAGTTSGLLSALTFADGGGVSFGLNAGTVTGTVATTYAASNHSHGNPTLALTNLSGTTASASNGLTLSLSAAAPAAGVGIEAGTRTATTAGNLRFETGNGITFGLDAVGGSIMTASHNGLTTAAQSDHSHGNPTLALTNLTGTTASASNGLTISLSAAAAGGGNTYSTHIPYYPASTGVQTLGAAGVTSASAFFWPIYLKENIVFNRIEQLMTFSNVSSATAASGAQSITHNFGIFSLDVTALKSISTGSYSIAATCNSGSATLSYPVSYSTGGGYTWTTTAGTASAQVQSLWGTVGNRIVTFGFGGNMTLTPGLYVLGLHQRQSTTNFNVGVIPALAGNVMAAMQNVGILGAYTTVLTGGGTHTKVPWGIATSTGAAGYGGSQLPTSMVIANISRTMTNMPMCTFISR